MPGEVLTGGQLRVGDLLDPHALGSDCRIGCCPNWQVSCLLARLVHGPAMRLYRNCSLVIMNIFNGKCVSGDPLQPVSEGQLKKLHDLQGEIIQLVQPYLKAGE